MEEDQKDKQDVHSFTGRQDSVSTHQSSPSSSSSTEELVLKGQITQSTEEVPSGSLVSGRSSIHADIIFIEGDVRRESDTLTVALSTDNSTARPSCSQETGYSHDNSWIVVSNNYDPSNRKEVHPVLPPPTLYPNDSLIVVSSLPSKVHVNNDSKNLEVESVHSTPTSLKLRPVQSQNCSNPLMFEIESDQDDESDHIITACSQQTVNSVAKAFISTQDEAIDETPNEKLPLLSKKKIDVKNTKSESVNYHENRVMQKKKKKNTKQPGRSRETYTLIQPCSVTENSDDFNFSEYDPLINEEQAISRINATTKRKRIIDIVSCILTAVMCIAVLATATGIALYESEVFVGGGDTYSTPALQGDYVLLPYNVRVTKMYQYSLHFTNSADSNPSYSVSIYEATNETTQIEPFHKMNSNRTNYPFLNQTMVRFDQCSKYVGKCVLGQYIYQAKNKLSKIIFDIALDSFVDGLTDIQIFAFSNFEYFMEFLQTGDQSKAIANVKIASENFSFVFKNIKSSYYFFVIQDIGGSSEWFTINRLEGTHVYYNATSSTPLCTMNTTNNYTCVVRGIDNNDSRFLGYIGKDMEGISMVNHAFNISYKLEEPVPTLFGHILISGIGAIGIVLFICLLVCILFRACCSKKLK